MILKRKEKYHHLYLKLNNPTTSAKTYWPILKSFYNDSSIISKQQNCMILQRRQICLMIFLLLNVHLQPISVLPSTISFKTHSRLNSTSFVKEDILKIIRNLNFNKARGHDDISIECDSEVVEALSLIYKKLHRFWNFP